ncbi:MAG: hypothetical protein IKJ40_04520 [Bacteroidales bacterium]|nr:hypothetical protein [Bacteroidales bacterium]
MKKHCIRLAIIIIATFGISSCIVYHPHNAELPLLHKQGQMQAEGSLSMSAPLLVSPAINASFAYSPINKLATQAAVSITDFKNLYAQGAAGTYFPFGKAVLECYAGYGYGISYFDHRSESQTKKYYIDGHYNLVYGQVNFGWAELSDGDFDIGVGLKGGIMSPRWDKITIDDQGLRRIEETHDDAHFLLEPQLMLRFGWEQFKFSINASYAFLDGWPTDNNYFNYERFSVGLGIHFNF